MFMLPLLSVFSFRRRSNPVARPNPRPNCLVLAAEAAVVVGAAMVAVTVVAEVLAFPLLVVAAVVVMILLIIRPRCVPNDCYWSAFQFLPLLY